MEQICDTVGIINNGQLLEIKSINNLKESIGGTKRLQIKVDYPNYAGKIVVNELRLKAEVAGNRVLVHADQDQVGKVSQTLIKYGINIFGIDIVSKSLEAIFLDIINNKQKGKTSIV